MQLNPEISSITVFVPKNTLVYISEKKYLELSSIYEFILIITNGANRF